MRNQYLSLLYFRQYFFVVKILSVNLLLAFNINRGFQCSFFIVSSLCQPNFRLSFIFPASYRVPCAYSISNLAQILLYYTKSRSSNKANPIVNGLNVTYIRRTPLSIGTPFSHTRGMFLRNEKTVWLLYLVSSVLIPMWSLLAILPPFPPLFHCPFCRRERLPWLCSSHVLLIFATQKKNKTVLAI